MSLGLDICIVGAGLGGLTAATAFRQQGHRVLVVETSGQNHEIGASIAIGTNAQRVLEHLGWCKENCHCVDSNGIANVDADTVPTGSFRSIPGGYYCHRVDLHEELKRLATGEGSGEPARLMLGCQVVACDPLEGKVTLKDGRIITADVILGADGIHSTVRTSILGYVETAPATGISAFRFLFDASKLAGQHELAWFTDPLGGRVVYTKTHPHRRFFACLCRNGSLVNVVAQFPDKRDQDKCSWSMPATRAEILEEFSAFHPHILRFLELAEDPILLWQLRALPLLPTWINGRAALLGDAAHATFPTLGQGAAMAIEDAGTLGVLFPRDTSHADVPARLAAYQELRKTRGEYINRESLEQFMLPEKRNLLARSPEMRKAILEHDAIAIAQENFVLHFGE
ncbi:hypothetical protein C8R44DRAFT_369609 [Mycena epipterygia]|nr:hypothetical protein C8R44DRAFT_369609 [Mycena epipterygia]